VIDMTTVAKVLIGLGLTLAIVGGVLWLLARLGVPLGRLPGDVRLQIGGVSVTILLATSILLSVVLTVMLNLLLRMRR
jgi:Protein of unknown function (DUF2905)